MITGKLPKVESIFSNREMSAVWEIIENLHDNLILYENMPCLFPMFSHKEFVKTYGTITKEKRPSFGLKNGLRLGTLSNAKAHRRRSRKR